MNRALFLALMTMTACGAPAASAPVRAPTPVDASVAPASGAAAASVKPTFAWKAGTTLGVVERIIDGTEVMALRYDMRVEAAPEGLRVAFSNVSMDGAAPSSPDALAKLAPALKADWLVTSRGAFARADLENARIAKMLASAKVPPEMAALMTEVFTASAKNGAKEDWRELVELWANRPMSTDAPGAAEATYDLGLFGPHPFDAKLTFAGYAPCDPAQAAPCAKLVSDAMSRDEKKDDESIHVHRVFELLADPATLLPSKSTLRIDTRIEMHGAAKENTIRVERTYAAR